MFGRIIGTQNGGIDVGEAVDFCSGVFEQLELGCKVCVVLHFLGGSKPLVVLNKPVRSCDFPPGCLDIIDRALLQLEPLCVRQEQRLGPALVYFILRTLEVPHKAVPIPIVIDRGREHDKPIHRLVALIQEWRNALAQEDLRAVERPEPFALVLVPMLNEAQALLVHVNPFELSIRMSCKIKTSVYHKGAEFFLTIRKKLNSGLDIKTLRNAHVSSVREIRLKTAGIIKKVISEYKIAGYVRVTFIPLDQL